MSAAPTLPDSTLARLLAGLEVRLNPNGSLGIRPVPTKRVRRLLHANRAAVLRLLGLTPVGVGDGTGDPPKAAGEDIPADLWRDRDRGQAWATARPAASFGEVGGDFGEGQDFTFASLFKKQVRSYE
jgi:hypothetical protein